jgi:hypothetical protein
VEFDAARSDALNGCTWLDLDAEVVARLEPETGRPAAASWACERADGRSPLLPLWVLPGLVRPRPSWVERFADGTER